MGVQKILPLGEKETKRFSRDVGMFMLGRDIGLSFRRQGIYDPSSIDFVLDSTFDGQLQPGDKEPFRLGYISVGNIDPFLNDNFIY